MLYVTCHCMKSLITIVSLLFFYSCQTTPRLNTEPLPKGKDWHINLENNLGSINIILPNYFDTSFKWTQTSDCGDGCSYVDYRVQPRTLPIFEESGFMFFPLTDSVEQFTVKHSKLNDLWQPSDTLRQMNLMGKLKGKALKHQSDKFIIDTFLIIAGRSFPIIGYQTYDSANKIMMLNLSALTLLKNNLLEFYFEYRKNYPDSSSKTFISNSLKYLKTIRINNGR